MMYDAGIWAVTTTADAYGHDDAADPSEVDKHSPNWCVYDSTSDDEPIATNATFGWARRIAAALDFADRVTGMVDTMTQATTPEPDGMEREPSTEDVRNARYAAVEHNGYWVTCCFACDGPRIMPMPFGSSELRQAWRNTHAVGNKGHREFYEVDPDGARGVVSVLTRRVGTSPFPEVVTELPGMWENADLTGGATDQPEFDNIDTPLGYRMLDPRGKYLACCRVCDEETRVIVAVPFAEPSNRNRWIDQHMVEKDGHTSFFLVDPDGARRWSAANWGPLEPHVYQPADINKGYDLSCCVQPRGAAIHLPGRTDPHQYNWDGGRNPCCNESIDHPIHAAARRMSAEIDISGIDDHMTLEASDIVDHPEPDSIVDELSGLTDLGSAFLGRGATGIGD